MDKNSIKKFAIWARRELISKVSQRAAFYGITDTEMVDTNAENINGTVISAIEKKQRQALIAKIKKEGFEQVMEEVAYSWFIRFVVIRYMEVNGFLPSHVRVFTDENGAFKPQILAEAINLELEGLDMEKVYALKEANDDEALYKYLFVTQCNALNENLPYMFARIEDYTELLLPDYLLHEGSVIDQMISSIFEEDWTDQVQIIGWLYQYYNTEKKDQVFKALKKNVKITKENIPVATQLFTPDWIVRYMVENSLGRLWTEGHPDADIKANWKYYLEEAKQEPEVEAELAKIGVEYAKLTPEDIKVIDPCMGSGHILVYAFEVLMQIYESAGYTQRDAAELIVEKNLYGLDIDDRAGQLAYFAVMMMARKYNRRILTKGITPNVMAIQDSSNMNTNTIDFIANGNDKIKSDLLKIKTVFADAKEYGSMLNIPEVDFSGIYAAIENCQDRTGDLPVKVEKKNVVNEVLPIVKQAQVMAQKYDVCVTNPPYMGGAGMNSKISDYLKDNYADYKSDLFSAFVVRCSQMTSTRGYLGFLTPYVWMFIQSYEKMRQFIYDSRTIETLIQFEYSAFEEATVPICTFAIKNSKVNKKGCYLRLTEFKGGMEVQRQKTLEAISNHDCGFYYEANAENFSKIPGMPVAYWVNDAILDLYVNYPSLGSIAAPRKGNSTSDNNRFLRLWFEVEKSKMNLHCHKIIVEDTKTRRWFPYNKGGGYRKWYGFNEYLIDWYNDAEAIRNIKTAVIANYQYFMKPGLTWSTLTSGNFSIRWFDEGYIFDNGGCCIFELGEKKEYLCALLNSKVFAYIFGQLNPTLNFQSGEVAKFPVKYQSNKEIVNICLENVKMSKHEYDDFENSWDFARHPFIDKSSKISDSFLRWQEECNNRFYNLKTNEEELNRIFIDIYGLQEELTPEVEDKDVSVRKADLTRDIKSFISYAVGCMFGRYSLDVEGLVYAGGTWDASEYASFIPDAGNIIPICDDEYFDNDIVSCFVEFVKVVYGEDTLEENLKFIADALWGKGTPREVIRNYFLKDFFADHCKTYQKRPIYWLFDSGKKDGLKCLVYMHRYQPDTIARIRTDYVHEQQSRYRTAIEDIENRLNGVSQSEKVKMSKKLQTIRDQADELRVYEEKIHHLADQMISIDLDDGVKVNYAKFQDVLAKIK